MNDQATEVTLLVTMTLEALGIPYAIGGSLATALHGVMRSALDSDIVADLRVDQGPLLMQRLGGEFYLSDAAMYDAIKQRTAVAVEAAAEQACCDKCKFYREITPPSSEHFPSDGECRIRSVTATIWPYRKGNDWCGEFKIRSPLVPD